MTVVFLWNGIDLSVVQARLDLHFSKCHIVGNLMLRFICKISSNLRQWFCCTVIDLLYFPLIVGVLCLSLNCYALLYVHSSFAIILKRKRRFVALLLLSYRCLVIVKSLALPHDAMSWSAVCDCGIS